LRASAFFVFASGSIAGSLSGLVFRFSRANTIVGYYPTIKKNVTLMNGSNVLVL
jgi:hypothetical protein